MFSFLRKLNIDIRMLKDIGNIDKFIVLLTWQNFLRWIQNKTRDIFWPNGWNLQASCPSFGWSKMNMHVMLQVVSCNTLTTQAVIKTNQEFNCTFLKPISSWRNFGSFRVTFHYSNELRIYPSFRSCSSHVSVKISQHQRRTWDSCKPSKRFYW